MVKYVLNFLIVFLMLSSFSFARNDEARLQKEYGRDLTQVSYVIRFAFQEKYHVDWGKTYYSDRKSFLIAYEADLAADQARKKAEANAEAAKEKAQLFEKKEKLRIEKERLKDRLAKEKAEKAADIQRQKEFNTSVSDEQKEIREMHQEVIQERENSQNK